MPTQDNNLTYREILRKVKKFGVYEVMRKGARRMLVHDNIDGKKVSFPMHVHSENQEFNRNYVRAIRDCFHIDRNNFYDV